MPHMDTYSIHPSEFIDIGKTKGKVTNAMAVLSMRKRNHARWEQGRESLWRSMSYLWALDRTNMTFSSAQLMACREWEAGIIKKLMCKGIAPDRVVMFKHTKNRPQCPILPGPPPEPAECEVDPPPD